MKGEHKRFTELSNSVKGKSDQDRTILLGWRGNYLLKTWEKQRESRKIKNNKQGLGNLFGVVLK